MAQDRIVEAYVGEYASGKSENAVNRALELCRQGRQVTLVDLDMVEPCFCLRPIKKSLEEKGLTVLAWETEDTFGLGEAGQTIYPQARWAMRRPGDVIFDVGYGSHGTRTLNLVEEKDDSLKILLVVNTCRPVTATEALVRDYVAELGVPDGFISNSHLSEETTPEVVDRGTEITYSVATSLNRPVEAVSVSADFMARYPDYQPPHGLPLRVLERWLPDAFW